MPYLRFACAVSLMFPISHSLIANASSGVGNEPDDIKLIMGVPELTEADGWRAFLVEHPRSRRIETHQRITRIYGDAISSGETSLQSAQDFVNDHAEELWGIQPEQLLPLGPFADGKHVQPMMTDPITGAPKFILVGYTPHVDGVPVYDSALRLLVRNEPGYPLVLASAQIPDVTGFSIPGGLVPTQVNLDQASRVVRRRFGPNPEVRLERPVVYAGLDGRSEMPRVAAELVLTGTDIVDGGYSKYRFLVDPQTGAIMHEENMIIHADVTVQVLGNVTDGPAADGCHEESLRPIPFAEVTSGTSTYTAGANGVVVIPNFSDDPVTVTGECVTTSFNVNSQFGDDHSVSTTIPSGGVGELILNETNESEHDRGETNIIYYAEEVRSFTLRYNSSYPVIATQQNFTCNASIDSSCNAYYDGNSINFYRAGNGCSNTGNATVVHHEYGHHLVNVAGSGQNEYGEGAGDCMGMLITGEPRLGIGFYSDDCENGIRNADNNCQYLGSGCSSCGSAIHSCGQLLSGMLWDVRGNFIDAGVSLDVVNSIFVNSILLHNGSAIDENIPIDWLTLDDDDETILNGTPNYALINNACADHGLPGPDITPIDITFQQGQPEFIDPADGAEFLVWIHEYGVEAEDGSQRITYRIDGGEWVSSPLEPISSVRWRATLPPAPCDSFFEYYIAVDVAGTDGYTSPEGAPDNVYGVMVGTSLGTTFNDDGETDEGWTVIDECNDGEWTRGIPVGGGDRGDPATDYDGSGACWLTDNVDGNTDVDGGTTTLISPRIDASNPGSTITYARWFSNCAGPGSGNEVFTVDVSDDDGENWVNLEVVGPQDDQSCGGWFEVSFVIGNFVENTDAFRIRFIAADVVNPNTRVEAGIDALLVQATECVEPPDFQGDLNGDGRVDGEDVGLFLAMWNANGGEADFNGDGIVDGADFGILLLNWTN